MEQQLLDNYSPAKGKACVPIDYLRRLLIGAMPGQEYKSEARPDGGLPTTHAVACFNLFRSCPSLAETAITSFCNHKSKTEATNPAVNSPLIIIIRCASDVVHDLFHRITRGPVAM
jgi:hypothetical protein